MSSAQERVRALSVLASVAAGVIVGTLGRNLPEAVAAALLDPEQAGPCGLEEVLECTLRSLPEVSGQLMILAVVVVAIDAVLALMGVVLAVIGGVRLRRASRHRAGQDRPGLGLLGLGVALVVPGCWLLGSFGVLVVSGRSG